MELNLLEIILASGIVVKSVLLILIFCSVYSWAIIWKKSRLIKKLEKESLKFENLFDEKTSLDELYFTSMESEKNPLSLMFVNGYGELLKVREKSQNQLKDYMQDHGSENLKRGLTVGVNLSNEHLEKDLSALASIGSITPFIGLFGTVWGIIDSFTGLAQGGSSIEAVAPGIAEALVATAVGLAAAIPAVWAYNKFSNRISSLNSKMESFGQVFLNKVERSIFL